MYRPGKKKKKRKKEIATFFKASTSDQMGLHSLPIFHSPDNTQVRVITAG